MKLKGWSLSCDGVPRILEMPETWNICWGKHKREVMWAAASKAIGVGMPKPTGIQSQHHVPWILDTELQNLMLALLGFHLWSHYSFLCSLFLLFGIGMFTLCHYMLEVCNLFLLCYSGSQSRVESQDSELGILNSVGALKCHVFQSHRLVKEFTRWESRKSSDLLGYC
jgi:hypothetical protein